MGVKCFLYILKIYGILNTRNGLTEVIEKRGGKWPVWLKMVIQIYGNGNR